MQFRLWVLVAISLATFGCFYPASRAKILEEQVAQLRADSESGKRDREQFRTTLDQKLAEVTAALDSLDKASRRSGADTGVQLQKTVEDVAQLRGQVDTYVHRIEELESSIQKLSSDTETKLTEMKGPEAVKAAEARKKAEELQRPSEPGPFLALAKSKAGDDPALGRQLYWEFLKKWPKDPGAGDAHFGIGETFAGENRCREALSEFGKVIQDYAKSKTAPTAYLRSASCFKTLKLPDDAKLALEELVRLHPKSDAAKKAKTELAELEKTKKPGKKK